MRPRSISFSAALILFLCVTSVAAQTSLTATNGSATLDGVAEPGEYTSQTLVTSLGVSFQAMGDGEFLYLVARWDDESESIDKALWTYDGANWTQSGNEDRLGIIWDLGLNGAEGANCTTMCHGTSMGTTNGMVDVWHWKSARGGTTNGVADDKWWFTEDDGRHSDSGTSAYMDNASVDSHPEFMQTGGPATVAKFLAADQAALDLMGAISTYPVALAVPFDPGLGWANGDTVPGYVLRVASGDRASVESMATYENGTWTVEFKKPYAGSKNDFTVIPGSSISFTHETFDNTGGGHPNDGWDATLYTLDFSELADQMRTSLAVSIGVPVLDGELSDGEWTSPFMVTHKTGVTFYSMADGNNLYLAAQWVDATGTESIDKALWTYDGANWTQSGNEDRLGIIWDMGLNGAEGAFCTTMCHGTTMGTSNGIVDVWHWKAARGGTTNGVADDKYWANEDDGRHSDDGTSAYQDNILIDGHPEFMPSGGPGTVAKFLAADQAALDLMTPLTTHLVSIAVPFDAGAAWMNGDVVPGYVLRVPSGDRASVASAATFNNGIWTVEFSKPYAGGDHDFAVVPGSFVEFSHEVFDNTGGGHPNDGWDDTIYTLDFATITGTGVQEFTDIESPAEFILDQNYPNPFNPQTTINYFLPESGRVRVAVFDVLGREVRILVNGVETRGFHEIVFDASTLPSGAYIYRLESGSGSYSRKMLLLK